MPLFFHPVSRRDPILDDTGQEFASLLEARGDAVASIRDLVADSMRHQGQFLNMAIEITDETGAVLDTIHARDAFVL